MSNRLFKGKSEFEKLYDNHSLFKDRHNDFNFNNDFKDHMKLVKRSIVGVLIAWAIGAIVSIGVIVALLILIHQICKTQGWIG